MGRNVYDIAVSLSCISGWDAEDLMTTRGPVILPRAIGGGGTHDAQFQRLTHRRPPRDDPGRPQHAEGLALFEQAHSTNSRQGGSAGSDPLLSGLNLRVLKSSAAGRTAEYENFSSKTPTSSDFGPNCPFKTIQEMIEKVGRDKFDQLMIEALDVEPPAKKVPTTQRACAPGHDPDRRGNSSTATNWTRSFSPQHAATSAVGRSRWGEGGGWRQQPRVQFGTSGDHHASRIHDGEPTDRDRDHRQAIRRPAAAPNRLRLRTGRPPAEVSHHDTPVARRRNFRLLIS